MFWLQKYFWFHMLLPHLLSQKVWRSLLLLWNLKRSLLLSWKIKCFKTGAIEGWWYIIAFISPYHHLSLWNASIHSEPSYRNFGNLGDGALRGLWKEMGRQEDGVSIHLLGLPLIDISDMSDEGFSCFWLCIPGCHAWEIIRKNHQAEPSHVQNCKT